ncbi:DDE-type integrase/transposase/recombinase [Glaciimonas sp. PCH181]|uniref:DDE-type integrase/transposase/recombinase n=1 Tax=Glaciimonas sp. PCH181 TaxID=2133943 RepID=UPI000D3CA943|nr:DDE-type integrase/transposase/recombinase [Glaciimonas sp. PCH181]PUA19484.1 hypothetical protein C7W93_06385 [Glaciimonas sp. PCH181]
MNEIYIKVKCVWKYFCQAVNNEGNTVDFLLTTTRAKMAAQRSFDKPIQAYGIPEKFAMDKSGVNKAAIDKINADQEILIIVRQVKHLNNMVQQDHRAIKRVTKPMLNCKSFRAAKTSRLASNSCT